MRVAAALGLAWNGGRELPDGARDLIHRNAVAPGPAARMFESVPWGEDENVMQNYCGEALDLIRDLADDSIASLTQAMNEVAYQPSLAIARQLLNRVFDAQPAPSTIRADQLTGDQRTVLAAIATSERLWHDLDGRVVVIATGDLMKEFALPQNIKYLQAFLEGRLTPEDADWTQRLVKRELTPEQEAERRELLAGARRRPGFRAPPHRQIAERIGAVDGRLPVGHGVHPTIFRPPPDRQDPSPATLTPGGHISIVQVRKRG
ncbi:MAG: hypothetical protein ACREIB_10065 [Pseudomonadota bacterium]